MMIEKVKTWKSRRYLAWVRERPCVHCRKVGQSEPHHIIGLTGGHMGGKTGDEFAVPLCRHCHDEIHQGHIDTEAQVTWLARTLEAAFHHGALQEGCV